MVSDSDTSTPAKVDGPRKPRNVVTFRGEPYTLSGVIPEVGSPAPDFRLHSWLEATRVDIALSDFLQDGVPVLLSVFASFDTPVSRLQAKVFDNRLRAFGETVLGVQISSDLPFTINRAFRNEELTSTVGASDYFDRNFGRAYGVLLEDSAVLARAVFIIDAAGILRYVEVPEEVTFEPDYDAALSVLESLVREADSQATDETAQASSTEHS
jgi:thioredoxin-dependent peroxiredoxin